ncbi:MAG TPA: aconitate hydratase [Victivallales bacterium]|nr:aconitate hydratase [Victivallales bacterium]HRR05675.1 aconitate hydratase [Victivallales bacterium]HRU01419.1 aconitate hydratase [Victivallales bacterium]
MAKGTLTQKIISSHLVSGKEEIGSEIAIKIDHTLTQDATGTMAYLELEAMGIERVKTEISVSYVDHNMLQNGPENHNDHLYLQSIAAAKGIWFSRPGNGICHQLHLERFGAPAKTLLGSDSHTPTGGGIGMLAIGAGGLDVALAMAGKPFRLSYPKVVGINLKGSLPEWVSAKDVILKVLSILTTKGNVGSVVEYFGEGSKKLSVPERATITNMGAELGVTTSIFPSDEQTLKFLKAQGRENSYIELSADKNADYDQIIEIDLSSLTPLAACPSSPDNIKTVEELQKIPVSQVIVGSCTNSSFRDLMLVREILKGKTISPSVSFAIAPGSKQVMKMLADSGAMSDLLASGARILESACGPCIGQGLSPANDTVSLRTFNRNFSGRSGTKNDAVYIVSPLVAAASALTGFITDPRTLKIKMPKIKMPLKFDIDDRMIIPPPPHGTKIEIIRKATIGEPPKNSPLPEHINGIVIIKAGDKITTDHIMPAGQYLKYRSNISEYSKYVFEPFNQNGKESFAQKALKAKNSGFHGIIVARESYGQGSSREHAAICPMYLGIKVVVACSIERIHSANLVNFGIIPLLFNSPSDYDLIEENARFIICEIRKHLKVGKEIKAKICLQSNEKEIILRHTLTDEDIKIILAGGRLHYE